MRASIVVALLLSSCAAPSSQCKRVTLMVIDKEAKAYMPHWHLGPSDIISHKNGNIVMTFPAGQQFAVPETASTIIDEVCR
jgi:hypothetical protein